MQVLIIADDLTGALDTAAPFSTVGLKTVVAPSRADLPAAISVKPHVLAVSTNSRDLPLPDALAAVHATIDELSSFHADIVFKKIDSRLQGHPAAEAAIVAERFGRSTLLIAPAIPELGRVVRAGCISGHAISAPLDVRSAFSKTDLSLEIADAVTTGDMLDIARRLLRSNDYQLAVAASGLARALSALLADGSERQPIRVLSRPALFAIGSRDPVTTTQIDRLLQAAPGLRSIRVIDGYWREELELSACHDVLVMMADGGSARPAAEAGKDFAAGVAKLISPDFKGTLITSGGNTTADLLAALNIGPLLLGGEWQPGMAISVPLAAKYGFTLISKSGGFGDPDCLIRLYDATASRKGTGD